MNHASLIGRLVADPQIKYTKNDIAFCFFTLAVDRDFVPKGSDKPNTDFLSCVVWGNQAKNLVTYCKKGYMLAVDGYNSSRTFTDEQGIKHYRQEITVNHMTFLTYNNDNSNNGSQSNGRYQQDTQAQTATTQPTQQANTGDGLNSQVDNSHEEKPAPVTNNNQGAADINDNQSKTVNANAESLKKADLDDFDDEYLLDDSDMPF